MGSRLRENPDKLFEVFAEVGRPEQEGTEPFILQKYPPDYNEQDVLNNIPKFSFPCRTNTPQVDQFAFVLTDLESLYRFGFCRHGTGAQTCLCIISHLPWYEVFYKMLNFLAEIVNRSENSDLLPFLKAAYEQSVPLAEEPVTIVAGQDMFSFTAPDSTALPSIPASRNLTEYYNAVDTSNMMRIFASMLQERRILLTSKKLSRVTACIHAAEALLYPMHWQHLYIPVLPEHLIDYVTAPMPYLIGVHTSLMEKVLARRMEIGDAVIVDADKNEVTTEYEDLEALPEDVSSYLKRHLKTQRVQTSMMDCGDAISRAFLQALVRLIGGYRDALKIRDGEPITFDRDAFVQTRSSQSMQVFLENMLQLQIFQQFINGRLELLNDGGGLTELFETESVKYADSLNTQSKYKEWLARVSKQKRKLKAGGKDIISDMKEKVKLQGKKVMSKVKEINENKMSSRKVSGGIVHSRGDRQRPSTIPASPLTSRRPPRPPPPSQSSQRPHTAYPGHTDRAPGYRSQLSVEEEGPGSHDDSHLRLSYHSIDVSLMTDTDIQNAMMRSASAEQLPRPDHHRSASPQSASEGDVSSTPSSEALSPSDDNLSEIPYLDMASTFTSSPQVSAPPPPTSSSEEELTRPPPLPAKDNAAASDRRIPADRLIAPPGPTPIPPPRTARKSAESRSTGSSPQLARPPGPKPTRRSSVEKGVVGPGLSGGPQVVVSGPPPVEKPLIQFESSESEADGVEQFDPLHSKAVGKEGGGEKGGDESPPPPASSLTRNKSSRNSLMRTAAFRRAPKEAPVRAGYRDDVVPDEERGSQELLADLFDPLAGQSSAAPSPGNRKSEPQWSRQAGGGVERGAGGSLMQDWTLDHLAHGGGGLSPAATTGSLPRAASTGASFPRAAPSSSAGFSRVPSGGSLTCPATAMPPFPHRPVSPMTSLTSNPLYVAPAVSMQSNPLYRPASGSGALLQSNPLYQLASSPQPSPPAPTPVGTTTTTTTPFKPWSSPGSHASQRLTPTGPQRGGGGGGLGPRGSVPQSSVVGKVNSPAPTKPPPPRAWETFD
ncbi:uncharacterized protein LOC143289725 isoform X2 [Babylonia areolata]|uniref:uncharacterized protein LOC143289724 isoform X2 n=1 Tax=Babylonia areolata TaxID=304850 RepID=UPI003FCF303D